MNDLPGLLLVERVNECVQALRSAGLEVAHIPTTWMQPTSLRRGLTERERDVLTRAVRGLTYVAIAAELNISQKTVGTYMTRVRVKTGARSRQDLRLAATDYGITLTP